MTRQRIFYRVRQLAALVLLASFWWWAAREMNYAGFSRIPLPQFGQIVPHSVKGIVVYITPKDDRFDTLLIRICFVAGIVSVIFVIASGDLSRMLNPPKPPLPPEL